MSLSALAISVFLLAANGFFVAVEFALVASRSTRLEALAEEGDRRAVLALASVQDLSKQLAGAQLGITIASLLLGYVAEPAIAGGLEHFFHDTVELPERIALPLGFTLGLTIVVFFHMVIGEMVPKNLAIAAPEKTSMRLARLNRAYVFVFSPVIAVLNALANAILRLLGVDPADELNTAHTPDEFASMVAESRQQGLIEDAEHALLSGALQFGRERVGRLTVPVDRVVSVTTSTTVEDAEIVAAHSGHSRLVVTTGPDLATAVGFVHVKDLLSVPARARTAPIPKDRIRTLPSISVDLALDEAVIEMQRARKHLALVRGTAGQVWGIVALEDVLEALVGEIFDETDRPERH